MPSAFFSSPAAGGIVLIIASAAAIIVANSPLREGYEVFLKYNAAGLSVEHWINDALMAVFFMMVGLEIKRELLTGQLATWGQRALPGFAALGGMAVPAAIYVWFNAGSDETLAGWAIPAATDIAFALGVLALLGSRVPASLKIFLSALAILDDMGAVAIIALFYTSNISFLMLAGAAVTVALLFIMNRAGITRLFPYLLAGGVLWFFMLQSGVHATIAGILLALFIPLRVTDPDKQSPLARLEHGINPWVTFLILPLFGFANAGVALSGMTADDLMSPVPVGVALGLFVGKQAGIFGLSLLAVVMIVSVLFPQITTAVANVLGVGRGADLLLYVLTAAFVVFALTQYTRNQANRRLTFSLARRIALIEAEARYARRLTP